MATDENRDEIERLVRQSCEVPAPDAEFVRALAAQARDELASILLDGPAAPRPRLPETAAGRPWRRTAMALAGLAAAILVGVLWSNRQESVAWARVAEAVRAMPWIHMKAVGGEGKSQETWVSFGQNITATRFDNVVQFTDLRSRVRYEYNVQQKKLYRLAVSDYAAKELQTEEQLFQAIIRGDAIRWEDHFPEMPIVQQRQRTATEEGRRWIVYELEFQAYDPQDRNAKQASIAIYVDPERKLPARMTFTRGKERTEATIDYPAQGPADIYALGVPRDAPVEDRTPSPELSRILKIVEQNRHNFGDYLAVAGGANRYTPLLVYRICCKGNKFRIDRGVGDTKRVASGDDMGRWWQRHGKDVLLEGVGLHDGRRVYHYSHVQPDAGWKPEGVHLRPGNERAEAANLRGTGRYFVDLLAYPRTLDLPDLASSILRTAHFDPKGENGPAGSVRVELRLASQGGPVDQRTYHREEFWLQPKYGYAVVKYVISDPPSADEAPRPDKPDIVYEYDGFRQTPRGLWYPTVSRERTHRDSQDKSKPSGVVSQDGVTYFHLDFTAELPDELFSTTWQGGLLGESDLAQGGGQPTANDLGKIRPPGGVPLSPARPHEITVEEVEAARQRLEAVPPAEFEKWIVELERIIGTKLKDGLPSARQACRTYFVTHMSVAFDGVKWNAKKANSLFQRAQTLPASEAKAWKEAFESLLKKEIGHTDTSVCDGGPDWAVPLVLIPVDALYEGQKYRPDHAKKYRARIGQLTADDVSLWKDEVDEFGGTKLDAAVNIILLDDYFDNEKFQRGKFKAAIEAGKKQETKAR